MRSKASGSGVSPRDWDDAKVVAFDVETSGTLPEYALQPWRVKTGDAWITSASALQHQGGQLTPIISQLFPTRMHLLNFLLKVHHERLTVLGWNIAFDISMLMALGADFEEVCLKINWLDGMLLWKHLEIEPEYEFQSQKHLKRRWRLKPEGVEQWIPHWAGKDEDVDFHSTDPADLAKLQAYNDRDNVRAWVISKMVWEKLADRQRSSALIEAAALPMVAQANLHGMMIDGVYLQDLGGRFDRVAAERLEQLAPHGMTEKIVRSPMQLGRLMYDQWLLPVLKENKSKVEGKEPNRSTDKEVLHELAFIDPRAKQIKEYREALNAKGKFVDSVRASLEYNGGHMTHPIAIIMGTYTGRQTVASKQGRGVAARQVGFALHQMMRDKAVREIVIAPPGCDILEFDAAGQEFRWMAEASGDETMLDLCQPGEDAHSFMGAQIVGSSYPVLVKEFHQGDKQAVQHRYLGKFANLSLQYRTSPRKLRSKARVEYDIPLEMPEAQRIHKTYQRSYPGVPRYWSSQIELVKNLGYVETFGGSRVNVVGEWTGRDSWSMGSTAINSRIQGTGADQKYLAMKYIRPILQRYGARFLFDLHDGLYLLSPKEHTIELAHELKHALDNLPYLEEWGYAPRIPMPWDCKVGPSWGKLKDFDFNASVR